MPKPIVLLTATIAPDAVPFLNRKDPTLREADYRWSVRGWMEVEGYDTFVFCENSDFPLDELQEYATQYNKFKKRLVFLSCKKNASASKLGKGFGEMEIIRYAIENGPKLVPHQLIVKVTGRYRAANATPLLRRLESMEGDVFCTLREKLTRGDSGLFAITPECARKQLLPRQSSLDDTQGRFFEHALGDCVHGTILSGGSWSPLPCAPLLYGHSGTGGVRFGFSPVSRIRSRVRNFLTKLLY